MSLSGAPVPGVLNKVKTISATTCGCLHLVSDPPDKCRGRQLISRALELDLLPAQELSSDGQHLK